MTRGADETDERAPPGPTPPPRRWLRVLPVAALVLVMVLVFGSGLHRSLSWTAFLDRYEAIAGFVAANRVGSALAFVGAYVAAVALSLPGAVFFTVGGGFLFGWLLGGVASATAATLGAVAVFAIARTSFGDVLLRRAGPRLGSIARGFQEDAFSYLLFMRLVPLFPFTLVNLAAALFGVPLRTFVAATALGILPGTFAFATAGAGLGSVVDAQRAALGACRAAGGADCAATLNLRTLLTPELLVAFVALGAVALIPVVVRRLSGRRLQTGEEG